MKKGLRNAIKEAIKKINITLIVCLSLIVALAVILASKQDSYVSKVKLESPVFTITIDSNEKDSANRQVKTESSSELR